MIFHISKDSYEKVNTIFKLCCDRSTPKYFSVAEQGDEFRQAGEAGGALEAGEEIL
ncbi:hypothetical protein [Nostoc sp.]|uniref:hypothetical protein n=1 Tax=Nostoc sp. TaxID=1180 RepID=UPI002FFAA9B0